MPLAFTFAFGGFLFLLEFLLPFQDRRAKHIVEDFVLVGTACNHNLAQDAHVGAHRQPIEQLAHGRFVFLFGPARQRSGRLSELASCGSHQIPERAPRQIALIARQLFDHRFEVSIHHVLRAAQAFERRRAQGRRMLLPLFIPQTGQQQL